MSSKIEVSLRTWRGEGYRRQAAIRYGEILVSTALLALDAAPYIRIRKMHP